MFNTLDVYEGDFINGYAHGKGKYTYADGGYYEGSWKNDKQDGTGVDVQANGERYEGDFRGGLKNGYGVYTWRDGSKYEGDFVDGAQEGRGTYTASTGEKYSGDWIGGLEHGDGVMEYPNGTIYRGEFKNSMRDGKGTLIIPGEGQRESIWKNDKEVGTVEKKNNIASKMPVEDNDLHIRQPVIEHFSSPKPDNRRNEEDLEEVPGGMIHIQRLSPQRSITPVINNEE